VADRRADLLGAAVIVVLDQITKALVRRRLALHESVNVVPGFLDLTHVQNTGAAFGMLNAADFPFKWAVLVLIAAVALGVVALYAGQVAAEAASARFGLALVLGGAVGNLIDRVRAGYVIDFVDVYWGSYHFWAFNVADAAITVGAAVLILDMLGLRWHVSKTV
jgi:signal peptidase II